MIDLESYCLLLKMFVFIEINQTHHFDNNIENLRRKLYRDDKMVKAENAMLKMLVDYSVGNSAANKIQLLEQHQQNIATILLDTLEQNINNYFPIQLWLKAKLEHKTIYQKFNQYLQDAYWETGWGFGFSYPASPYKFMEMPFPTGPLWRIDHVFHSQHFSVISARTLTNAGGSDHLPVVVELSIVK